MDLRSEMGWLPGIGDQAGSRRPIVFAQGKKSYRRFPGVVEAVRGIRMDSGLIDGEVVAINKKGCPSFQALQNRISSGKDWQIVYYAFDLLKLDGEDWTRKPLH